MLSAVMSTALSGMKAQQDRAAAQADTVANYTRPDTTSKDVVTISRAGGTVTASTQQVLPPEAAGSAVATGQRVRTPPKPATGRGMQFSGSSSASWSRPSWPWSFLPTASTHAWSSSRRVKL